MLPTQKPFALFVVAVLTLFLVLIGSTPAKEVLARPSTIDSPLPPPPPNDNFGSAALVNTVPFVDNVNLAGATVEAGEPVPYCGQGYDFGKTVWYSFTPAEHKAFVASGTMDVSPGILALYRGSDLASLALLDCRWIYYGETHYFVGEAGVTYYFQVADLTGQGGVASFRLDLPPPPLVSFYYWPIEPSVFDTIQFYDASYDPANQGIQFQSWDFGDGTTATGCCTNHKYAKDGDYTVQLVATTTDGRNNTYAQPVSVRTHDVAITKFRLPKTGRVGRTEQVSVSVSNKRYPETVRVELMRSGIYGFETVGWLSQYVPVHSNQRTTDFLFSYTFTEEDAYMGKVSFKAIAYLAYNRDALPGDNEAISPPVPVRGGVGAASADEAEGEMIEIELAPVSSPDEMRYPPADDETAEPRLYLPLITAR